MTSPLTPPQFTSLSLADRKNIAV